MPGSRCLEQYLPFSPGIENRGCLEQSGPAHLPPFTFCIPKRSGTSTNVCQLPTSNTVPRILYDHPVLSQSRGLVSTRYGRV